MNDLNSKRLAELVVDSEHELHGTLRGYKAGCRCEKCRQEISRYQMAFRRRAAASAPIADQPNDPRHGTINGYGNRLCRCERCRAAWAASVAERTEKRASHPIPSHVHGTPNGYGNYRCRCTECTEAHRKYQGERRLRRKESQK